MKVHNSQWALDSFSVDRPSQLRMVSKVKYSGSQRSRSDSAQEGLGQSNLWGSRLPLHGGLGIGISGLSETSVNLHGLRLCAYMYVWLASVC